MLASRVVARSARVAAPRMSITATRAYAEPAKSSGEVKPPVQVFGLDGTYATALVRRNAIPSSPRHLYISSCEDRSPLT